MKEMFRSFHVKLIKESFRFAQRKFKGKQFPLVVLRIITRRELKTQATNGVFLPVKASVLNKLPVDFLQTSECFFFIGFTVFKQVDI